MELTLGLVSFALCICGLIGYSKILKWKNKSGAKIPGPNFLEVLLNFHKFGTTEYHNLLTKWNKQYGDVYQYSIFGQPFLVTNTPETIKACLNDMDRNDYPPLTLFEEYTGGKYGLTGSKGKDWQEQRTLVVHSLKRFGPRSSSICTITEDINSLVSTLKSYMSKPVDFEKAFQLPIVNMIWRLTSSVTLTEDQAPLLKKFIKLFGVNLNSKLLMVLGPFLPIFNWEPDFVKEYRKTIEEFWKIVNQNIIAERVNVHDDQKQPKDYVDTYLTKMKDSSRTLGTSFEGDTGINNLRGSLMDVNLAGAPTLYHMFQYVILQLVVHQDIQNRVRQEVESVLGTDGDPTPEDRKRLPYVVACIWEMMREFTAGDAVFHLASKDSTFQGHLITSGTIVLGNIWSSNHNEEIWPDPFTIKPERFLNESGTDLVNTEKVVTFSGGKRKCPGETISRDILFLLICKLVQQFEILPHPDHPIVNTEAFAGFFLEVLNFRALFVNRQANRN